MKVVTKVPNANQSLVGTSVTLEGGKEVGCVISVEGNNVTIELETPSEIAPLLLRGTEGISMSCKVGGEIVCALVPAVRNKVDS